MNKIAHIQKENNMQFKIHKWVLFYFFIIISLPPLRYNQMIYWSTIILIAVILCYLLILSKIRINTYIIWIIIVNIFVLSSFLWSENIDFAVEGMGGLLAVSVPFIYVSMLIKSKNDLYQILKLFIYSKVIMALYILINIDIATLSGVRIGTDVLGDGWNANNIGMNMAICSFMLFLLIKKTRVNKIKLFYIVLIILFTLITLLSGSRKALFILIFSIGIYAILSSKKHKFSKSIIASLFGILFFYLVTNIPFLYDVLGSRIDSLVANFSGTGVVDRSTEIRMSMMEYGMSFFYQQPVFGYGINNFRELFGLSTGAFEYAHNNYVELLVGIGIIGTLIYYSIHFYILKKAFLKSDTLLAFAFVSIFTILIIDVGLVSYTSFYIQFLICISFSIIRISQQSVETVEEGSVNENTT